MTIKEVAEIAGVSPAAVSRFLNGGPISEEKKARVRTAIEETGFSPNLMARSMRTGRGDQVGIIVPKLDSDSVSGIVAGVTERLKESNYSVMLGISGGKQAQELSYINVMQNQHIAGIILMATAITPDVISALNSSSKPVVVTGQNFKGFNCVCHDDFHAMYDLTKLMLEKGRKKIAYIGVSERDEAAGRARHEGTASAWSEAHKDSELITITAAGFNVEDGNEAMLKLLKKHPYIDGVICATDRLAIGAMTELKKAGKRIPDDVAIAGVGDGWIDNVTVPPLTSVHLYFRQCGIEAANMLLEMINSEEELPPRQMKLAYSIVERESL